MALVVEQGLEDRLRPVRGIAPAQRVVHELRELRQPLVLAQHHRLHLGSMTRDAEPLHHGPQIFAAHHVGVVDVYPPWPDPLLYIHAKG